MDPMENRTERGFPQRPHPSALWEEDRRPKDERNSQTHDQRLTHENPDTPTFSGITIEPAQGPPHPTYATYPTHLTS